jgi:hypothetical protein
LRDVHSIVEVSVTWGLVSDAGLPFLLFWVLGVVGVVVRRKRLVEVRVGVLVVRWSIGVVSRVSGIVEGLHFGVDLFCFFIRFIRLKV